MAADRAHGMHQRVGRWSVALCLATALPVLGLWLLPPSDGLAPPASDGLPDARPLRAAGAVSYSLALSWTLPSDVQVFSQAICPEDLFYDTGGQLLVYLVACRGGQPTELARLTSDGQVLNRRVLDPGNPYRNASALALDPSGETVIFANSDGIHRHALAGAPAATLAWPLIGRPGSSEAEELPASLSAAADGSVAAFAPAGISRYGPGSARRAPWPAQITPEEAAQPGSLVRGADGAIFLVDASYGGGVYRFSADGKLDEPWALDGVSEPLGPLAARPASDEIYALEGGGSRPQLRLRVFDPSGRSLRWLALSPLILAEPRPRLAAAPDGGYAVLGWLADGQRAIYLHAPDGAIRGAIQVYGRAGIHGLRLPPAPSQLPHLDASEAGAVAVQLPFPGDSFRFDAEGGLDASFETAADSVDLALLADGRWIRRRAASLGQTILERLDDSGRLEWSRVISASSGMGLAADGRLAYAADAQAGSTEVLLIEDGRRLGWLKELPRRNFGPQDLDLAPDGLLYTLDRLRAEVQIWNPFGHSALPVRRLSLGIPDLRPEAIAIGPEGRIAVAAASRVWVFDATGGLVWTWADTLPTVQGLVAEDLAFDGAGRLVVLANRLHVAIEAAGTKPGRAVYVFESQADPGPPLPFPTPSPAPTPAPSHDGLCQVFGDKTAHPSEIWLGETVTLSLSLGGRCPELPPLPADIVLVVDRSGSMRGEPAAGAADAVRAFVAGIDLRQHRIGIVTFASSATLFRSLDASADGLARLPASFGAGGGTNIALGLGMADLHLERLARPDVKEVIVLLSDGGSDRVAALAAADAARMRGVELYAVGLGGADEELLLLVAGDPARYHYAPGSADLARIFRLIASQLSAAGQGLVLEDVLAPDMEYVAGSASEPPFSPPGASLRWLPEGLTAEPITYTYRLRPTQSGDLPTNAEAWFDYQDADGQRRRFVFPLPRVLVRVPTATPSATPIPTPSPTATPSPSPEPPRPVFLPLLLREFCSPETRRVDVVLAIDTSTSMLEPARGYASKLDAAGRAAAAFIDRLDLDAGDQAAILGFSADARRLAGLGSDRSALSAALARLEARPQTCLPCAVELAAEILAGPEHRAENSPVVILMTDGRSNPRPATEAVDAAATAKAQGLSFFTIGLGAELDFEALKAIASRPDYFHIAPEAEDLERIYAEIAVALPCPSERFWGRRVVTAP